MLGWAGRPLAPFPRTPSSGPVFSILWLSTLAPLFLSLPSKTPRRPNSPIESLSAPVTLISPHPFPTHSGCLAPTYSLTLWTK